MVNTILGIKSRMTQAFVGDERVSVTVVKVTPNFVTQVKSAEKDGYMAVQLATGSKKTKNTSKPLLGHLKGAVSDKKAPNFLREIKITQTQLKQGDKVSLTDVLSTGDTVIVTGVSKGKGFAGGVKRWGFAGGSKTHGQSDRHRAPGSIGQGTTPGRVYKGKHMAGRMGSDTKTIKNLQVIGVDPETNEVMISGSIPGTVGTLITIKRLGEMKNPIVADQPSTPEQKEQNIANINTPEEVQTQPETTTPEIEAKPTKTNNQTVEDMKAEVETTEEVKENQNA